jgi:carboxymethylenebutenolidase
MARSAAAHFSTPRIAVGGVTAAALFEMLKPNYAWAVQVPEQDSRIASESATVPSSQGNGTINWYLVRPSSATAKLPLVLVIHEPWSQSLYP